LSLGFGITLGIDGMKSRCIDAEGVKDLLMQVVPKTVDVGGRGNIFVKLEKSEASPQPDRGLIFPDLPI
jgi:hypothetical protein